MMKLIGSNKGITRIIFVLILILLLLTIPFRLIVGYLYPTFPTWASNTLQLGTYILLCLSVWINRNNLNEYHIRRSAVVILILSGTLFRIGSFSLTNVCFWLAGTALFVVYLKKSFYFDSQTKNVGWPVISCFIGIGLPVVFALLFRYFYPNRVIPVKPWPGLVVGGFSFLYQISHVAVLEEFLFRGFLWGYLGKIGWDAKWILFFQAVLFWVAHLFYLEDPFAFWITIPILGLVLGLVMWRSRSVTASMIVHAIYNTVALYFI